MSREALALVGGSCPWLSPNAAQSCSGAEERHVLVRSEHAGSQTPLRQGRPGSLRQDGLTAASPLPGPCSVQLITSRQLNWN